MVDNFSTPQTLRRSTRISVRPKFLQISSTPRVKNTLKSNNQSQSAPTTPRTTRKAQSTPRTPKPSAAKERSKSTNRKRDKVPEKSKTQQNESKKSANSRHSRVTKSIQKSLNITQELGMFLSSSSSESSIESSTDSSEIHIRKPKRKYTKRSSGQKSVGQKKSPKTPHRRRSTASKQFAAELFAGIFNDEDTDHDDPSNFDWDINEKGIFMNKWMLLEKINNIPHTSPVYRVMNNDGVYGDLRCYTKKEIPRMNMEVLCLDKMERFHKSHMFRKICEVQTVKSEKEGSMSYLVTYHRSGPSLKDVMDTEGTLDARSSTKIGIEIFEIIENLTKSKLLMTNISSSFFSFDTYSQRLFLADSTKVVGNFERSLLPSKDFPVPKWCGGLIYAPYKYHKNKEHPLSEGDFIESVFYFYLDMMGMLAWKDMSEKEMAAIKKKWSTATLNEMLTELPNPLVTCWLTIRRGQLVDVCRSHTMSNGTVLLHQFRNKGLKKKIVPTAAMVEFPIIYECLRLFGTGGEKKNFLSLPSCIQQKLPIYKKGALLQSLMHIKMEKDAVLAEIKALEKRLNSKEIHDKVMTAEVERNERFIQKYVFDDVKQEKREGAQDDVVEVEQEDFVGEHSVTYSSRGYESTGEQSRSFSSVSTL